MDSPAAAAQCKAVRPEKALRALAATPTPTLLERCTRAADGKDDEEKDADDDEGVEYSRSLH